MIDGEIRKVCPVCEPEADPTKEVFETKYCVLHQVSTRGADDSQSARPTGSVEAGGDSNRRWCDFFARRGEYADTK